MSDVKVEIRTGARTSHKPFTPIPVSSGVQFESTMLGDVGHNGGSEH